MSLLSMLFAFSIVSYARDAISEINIDIVCSKEEITVEDIYVQANTPHYTCERKEFQPVTQHVTLYLRAADGYMFTLQQASKVTLTGAEYVRAAKQESSYILALTVKLPDNIKWLEDRGGWQNDETGIKHQFADGSYATNGWYKINEKYYYFDESGHVLLKTTTPDGYKVDSEGVWNNASPEITAKLNNAGNVIE